MPTMPTLKTFSQGAEFPPLQAGILRLYSMRFCPFAQRTRLVLAHKKIQFETVNVHLKKKPEWFVERNPLGLVPVLEQDGKVVYESEITCDYLDEIYPEEHLTPSDPYRRAQDRMLLERFGKVTSDFYGALRSRGENKEAIEMLKNKLNHFEDAVGERGTFFGGDKPAMIDYMMWPWFERLPLFVAVCNLEILTEADNPKLKAWVKNMYTLPAVKETMFDDATHVKFVKSIADPDYDIGLPA